MLFRHFKTQEELDAAYDVERSVPDFTVLARQYTEASAAARRDLPHVANVSFGATRAEYADIFPAASRGAPVLIFIHGGYWRILSAKEFSFVARAFAPMGVTVVVANYALCPAVTIPEIARQMRALVAWCARNIDRYNGDPENITVSGHSAGGHLAAMCALTDWRADYGLPARTVRTIVPISGLFDLEPISLTFMQPDLRISARDIEDASPQRQIAPCPSRMLITYGSDESSEFSRHSEEFRASWEAAGNHARQLPQLGRNHFTAITDLGDPDAPLSRAIFEVMDHTPRAARRRGGVDTPALPAEGRGVTQFLMQAGNLNKAFGAVVIAEDVSFDIPQGEVVGIIGPNGAGKTTLFGLLAGTVPLDSGRILFAGRDVTPLPTQERARLGIARTYQVPRPFSHMTVRENLRVAALFAGQLEQAECDDWVDEVLAFTGLAREAPLLAGRLPLLGRKRHELARALSTRPNLVLIDEVAAGLTDAEVDAFIDLVGRIKGAGITVVWIEHVMKAMLRATDRLLALAGGRIIAQGRPEDVIQTRRCSVSISGRKGNLFSTPGRGGVYPILTVDALSAWYGELRALHDISFTVNPGEVVSVIGANGAGKSTLLHAMTGMMNLGKTAHIAGRIECQGRRLDKLPTEKIVDSGVTMVPEGRMLFQRMTVAENLLVGAHLARVRARAAERIEEIYEFFPRLAERRHQPVRQMSGGEQQMVAIGRALMSDPTVIMFDELSLGLAPIIVDDIYQKVRQINQGGVTCLVIEQDMKRALAVADHVLVMLEGEIVLDGAPSQVSVDEITDAYFGKRSGRG